MTESYERDLTPAELEERAALRDKLDDERDALLVSIEDRRREVRGFVARCKKIASQVRDIRREIRSGKVIESPQISLALDLATPDPFAARYPMARDHARLHSELAVVLQGVLVPSIEKLEKWHVASGVFDAMAHWARTELAHMNRKEHPDLQLPQQFPMPVKLAALRAELQCNAEARQRESKRKPRPADGTPVRTGQGRRAKAASKGARK